MKKHRVRFLNERLPDSLSSLTDEPIHVKEALDIALTKSKCFGFIYEEIELIVEDDDKHYTYFPKVTKTGQRFFINGYVSTLEDEKVAKSEYYDMMEKYGYKILFKGNELYWVIIPKIGDGLINKVNGKYIIETVGKEIQG
jgi:hypothetical protein